MVPAAPRIDKRLLAAIARLDDREQSLAEIARRVGGVADELELTRPSYAQLRRLILQHRIREDDAAQRRQILKQAATRAAFARFVDAYEVADRVADEGRQ